MDDTTGSAELPTFEDIRNEKVQRDGIAFFKVPRDVLQNLRVPSAEIIPPTTRRRPEANSKLLKNSLGSIFLVIGGVAYGYTDDAVFKRVHYRCYHKTVRNGPFTFRLHICPRFYDFSDFSDIQTNLMDVNVTLRISPVNAAVYLIRSGFRHGITSAAAFENYQFDWDDVKDWVGTVDDWNLLREGTLLTETTGGRTT